MQRRRFGPQFFDGDLQKNAVLLENSVSVITVQTELAMCHRVFPVQFYEKRLARLVTQFCPVGANPLGDILW